MLVLEDTPRTEGAGCAWAKGSPAALLPGKMACGGGGGGLGGKKAASKGAVWDALSFVWIVTPPLIVTTGSTCTCHQHECLTLGVLQPDKEAHKQHAPALGIETTTTGLEMRRDGHVLTCLLIIKRRPCYTNNHVPGPSVPFRKGAKSNGFAISAQAKSTNSLPL